ncbi:MAG: hypothetical protein ACP5HZ_11825 [Ferrimicrobium sp.]
MRPWDMVNSGLSRPLLDTPANRAECGGTKCFGVLENGTWGLKVSKPLPFPNEAPPRKTGEPTGIAIGATWIPEMAWRELEEAVAEQAETSNANATGKAIIALTRMGGCDRVSMATVYRATTRNLGLKKEFPIPFRSVTGSLQHRLVHGISLEVDYPIGANPCRTE